MATPIVFNGVNYSVPGFGDVGYAQGPGNLSAYLVAIASGTFQTTGGLFSLTADANFGPNFGLVSIYYKSASANIAQSGVLRLANTDVIAWRNFANTGDLPLGVNTSDQLTYNGLVISTSVTNGTVNTGVAGRLTLYPAAGNTVDDVYVQNAQNIDLLIAAQAARTVPLQYTIPNPGNAVAAATFALLELAQTFTAPQTFGAATFTGLVSAVNVTLSGLLTGVNATLSGDLTLLAGHSVIFTGATSGTVTMKAPATVTTPYTFTLPPIPGTSGQFLQTDGSGTTVWAPAGGVGTFEYVTYTVGTPSGTYTGSTTVFNLPFTYVTDGKHIEVFYNGQQLRFNNDYTETSSTSVTTTSPLIAGQAVWFRTVTGGIVAPATVTLLREDYIVGTASGTYTGSTTVFNLGNTYTVGGNVLMVTLDGDVQTKGASADYLETNSNTVTFNVALVVGQRVSFIWSQTVGVSAGIVNAGTINQLAFYASSTSQVSGAPNVTVNAAGYLKGTIVQAVQVIDTVSTSTSATTFTTTTTAASITPLASTHKIRVTISGSFQSSTWTAPFVYASIFRGSTDLSPGGFGFAFIGNTLITMNAEVPCSMTILDSPATTSATTYSLRIKCSGAGGSAIWNNNNVNAIILLEEVAF